MKFTKAGILTKILILTLLIYAAAVMAGSAARMHRAREEIALLSAQAEKLERENALLRRDIAMAENDEVIAAFARERLGLVMPGEIVFCGYQD